MIEKVLEVIDIQHNTSNGKCGISPVSVCRTLNVSYPEIKDTLNYLYENNLMLVRKGINGYLLFKKEKATN